MRLRLRFLPAAVGRMLKRRAPTSLFGRSLLIIILPVALMQIAVAYVFFDSHWQTVNSQLTEGLAGDVAILVQDYQDDPRPQHLARLQAQAQQSLDLTLQVQRGTVLPLNRRTSLFVAVDRSLQAALAKRIRLPFWFDTEQYRDAVDVRVKVAGGVLRIIAPTERVFATRGHIFIAWLTGATVLLTAIAVLFIRNQVRAIERLAQAAEAFGKGDDIAFVPHGAREVRQAARAFLSMKSRIQRHVEQRTTLLAAVSHDLRTPMTRLKLELALAEPSAHVEAMQSDLSEMEHMIDEYLDFARGQGPESLVDVGLRGLIEGVSRGFPGPARIILSISADLRVRVRPQALRRAMSNLVANAAFHGTEVEVMAAQCASGGVDIWVDDNGPGIASVQIEAAFTPFVRLDSARNQNHKGVGLGLAITRDIIRAHGGEVTLLESPLGGLRAQVWLPG